MWLGIAPVAVLIAMFLSTEVVADQTDERLDSLFKELRDVQSLAEAREVEAQIWHAWVLSGRSDVDVLVANGISQMGSGRLDDALETFDRVVEMAPDYAEGWNKRATIHYLKDNYLESVQDISKTLDLEPRHFGAMAGMGLILVETGDDVGAARAFEEVLVIHPHAVGARENLERIRKRMQGRTL